MFPGKKQKSVGLAAAAFALCAVAAVCSAIPQMREAYYQNVYHYVAAPAEGGVSEVKEMHLADNADFYVSPRGDDLNDGSFAAPFRTLERARAAVAETDKTGKNGITVAVMAGEYRVDSLVFAPEDGGTEACPVIYRAYSINFIPVCKYHKSMSQTGKKVCPKLFWQIYFPKVCPKSVLTSIFRKSSSDFWKGKTLENSVFSRVFDWLREKDVFYRGGKAALPSCGAQNRYAAWSAARF